MAFSLWWDELEFFVSSRVWIIKAYAIPDSCFNLQSTKSTDSLQSPRGCPIWWLMPKTITQSLLETYRTDPKLLENVPALVQLIFFHLIELSQRDWLALFTSLKIFQACRCLLLLIISCLNLLPIIHKLEWRPGLWVYPRRFRTVQSLAQQANHQ